jgi:hypothetical protein
VRVEEGSHQFVSNWIKKIADYGMKDSIPIRDLDMKSTGRNQFYPGYHLPDEMGI